ncbi:hypothetical protein ACU4GA_28030 [Methylobacterium oryzae CBMB20]
MTVLAGAGWGPPAVAAAAAVLVAIAGAAATHHGRLVPGPARAGLEAARTGPSGRSGP